MSIFTIVYLTTFWLLSIYTIVYLTTIWLLNGIKSYVYVYNYMWWQLHVVTVFVHVCLDQQRDFYLSFSFSLRSQDLQFQKLLRQKSLMDQYKHGIGKMIIICWVFLMHWESESILIIEWYMLLSSLLSAFLRQPFLKHLQDMLGNS